MPQSRRALTPEALELLQEIAQAGSFAAAARNLGMVPSALTYRVRQIEDALDVLLFNRSSRQAKPTEAGRELLREGPRLLLELDAVANRVKRVATGWESQFTVAVDSLIHRPTVLELCAAFFALNPPTRLRLRDETLSGTLETLVSGQADLALGVAVEAATQAGLQAKALGSQLFVFAVAPHHALAGAAEPLGDETIRHHRAVAVADTVRSGSGITQGLLSGQEVFTVPSMAMKLEAQLRGLGCGYLPQCLVAPYAETGRLVVKKVERPERHIQVSYAWRKSPSANRGKALQWWLEQLQRPATLEALMGNRRVTPGLLCAADLNSAPPARPAR